MSDKDTIEVSKAAIRELTEFMEDLRVDVTVSCCEGAKQDMLHRIWMFLESCDLIDHEVVP